MVKIIENDSTITIEIYKNPELPLDEIYTRDYFSLLDLEILDNNNKMGGYKRLGGGVVSSVLKMGENISDAGVDAVNKRALSVIDATENALTKKIPDLLNDRTDADVIRFLIKKKPGNKMVNLKEHLDLFVNFPDNVTRFKSGMEYLDVENVIKDVFIQLSYLDFLNVKIETLKMENVYRINNRFVVIEESDLSENETDGDFSSIRNIQKMVVELTGEEYEKGNVLEKMKMIEGTRLYKLLKRLSEGRLGVW